ncbi:MULTISPECIES: S1C family serine protease [Neobacillus]|uniref:Trypsin-like peptidase domain-containing protein n=1 Tax=Neobacillus rhizophilus TaxID=2833579 RepID=A0A942U7D3_9BACI|nr:MULTISPECIES: serine protease [Neobacillus]MBS4214775.1 trypsin-like peptidase domain-containing protein [Neobacillus rhizophilus]
MDKENQDFHEEQPDWEALFTEEEAKEWEKDKAKRKKRKKMAAKIVSSLLVFAMLISGLGMWFDVFNLPAIHFVKVSNQLSKKPEVKEYKKAVVTLEWDGAKGTGFNIAPDGLIITNEHVVEKSNRVNVHFSNGDSFAGKVIAKRPEWDLAIVDIEKAKKLPVLSIAVEKEWETWAGEKIIFIGNPLAYTQIANEGTFISPVLVNGLDIPVMMIEAPIYKGNSGSPVINQDGQVIGVIFATLQNPEITTKEIIGAAVPSYYIQQIMEEINKDNKLEEQF